MLGGQVQHVRPGARCDLGGQHRLRAQRLIGRGQDSRVHLGHQVGRLVQEHNGGTLVAGAGAGLAKVAASQP